MTDPLCSSVLMLKPRVGEMVSMSSPLNFFRMVVLPALSKPLNNNCMMRYVEDCNHLEEWYSQHEDPDFLLFLLELLKD